jgi:hypothetical protein
MADDTRLIPATPTTIVPWILQVLRDGPRKRSELLRLVDSLARLEGYRVDNLSSLKKALGYVESDGRVVKRQYGWRALATASSPRPSGGLPSQRGKRSEVKHPKCPSDPPLRDSRPERYNRIWTIRQVLHL